MVTTTLFCVIFYFPFSSDPLAGNYLTFKRDGKRRGGTIMLPPCSLFCSFVEHHLLQHSSGEALQGSDKLFCSQSHRLDASDDSLPRHRLLLPSLQGLAHQGRVRRPFSSSRDMSSNHLSCFRAPARLPAQPSPAAAPGQCKQARHRNRTPEIFLRETSYVSIWANQSCPDLVTNFHA